MAAKRRWRKYVRVYTRRALYKNGDRHIGQSLHRAAHLSCYRGAKKAKSAKTCGEINSPPHFRHELMRFGCRDNQRGMLYVPSWSDASLENVRTHIWNIFIHAHSYLAPTTVCAVKNHIYAFSREAMEILLP